MVWGTDGVCVEPQSARNEQPTDVQLHRDSHTTPYTSYVPLDRLNNARHTHYLTHTIPYPVSDSSDDSDLTGTPVASILSETGYCQKQPTCSGKQGADLCRPPAASTFSPSLSLTRRSAESVVFPVPDNSATLWSKKLCGAK